MAYCVGYLVNTCAISTIYQMSKLSAMQFSLLYLSLPTDLSMSNVNMLQYINLIT